MTESRPNSLKDRIIAALTDTGSGLWFPYLTFDLVQSGLQRLYEETGISESQYGTTRVIFKDVCATRFGESNLFPHNEIFLEFLPAAINEKYLESGAAFYTREDILSNSEILKCVNEAFRMISQVPSLFSSVCFLVKSIHLIKPDDDNYDVSFSEPHIPFSIFVSVPMAYTPINALRVAEAIIHEAMHLQLTLIENIVQLVTPGGELVYSPWKEEYRTVQGVMHALYVFIVLDSFFLELSLQNISTNNLDKHLNERHQEISNQINKVQALKNSNGLTKTGKEFLAHLTFFYSESSDRFRLIISSL